MSNNNLSATITGNQTEEKDTCVLGSVMEITGAESIEELGVDPRVQVRIPRYVNGRDVYGRTTD